MGKPQASIEPMVIVYDPSLCTGCQHCQIACSYKHFNVYSIALSNIRVLFNEETGSFEAVTCFHCEKPVCMEVCPVEAIYKEEETGIVRIREARCIGCRSCIIACPISAPWFNEEKRKTYKCDLCDGEPECVKFCSPGALKLMPRGEALERLKEVYNL